MSVFMIGLDATVVNVAIPAIQDSLHASLNDMVWVNSAYALCYAVPLILAGRLGDRYGPKKVFLIGVAGFTCASLACAVGPGAEALIAARAVQGLAAALIAPQAMTLIVHMFPAEQRGRPLGLCGAVGGASMAAGPLVGGLISDALGWRGIFLINVPVGVVGWIAAVRLVPDWQPARRHRLDIPGILLSGVGLFAVVFAVQSGEHYDWGTVTGPLTIGWILALGLVAMAGFVFWQYRNPREPLLPLRLFRSRGFSAASGAGAALGCAMSGLFLPLMIYLQNTLHHSALVAGAVTVPMFVLSSFAARHAGRRADSAGPRLPVATGFGVLVAGVGSLTLLLRPGLSLWCLMPSLLLSGIGLGLVSTPLARTAMSGLEPGMAGVASGVFNTTRQVGGAFGSAASGVLLQASLGATTTDATRAALVLPVAMLLLGLLCCTIMSEPGGAAAGSPT
ncbi:DHA2 family efflux MFS transporter permease subunit [Streptomyces sp. TRM72054]|nr:DHA2 family efflux MFS transporter permease subunit [Streptomyces sp. TRM72054]